MENQTEGGGASFAARPAPSSVPGGSAEGAGGGGGCSEPPASSRGPEGSAEVGSSSATTMARKRTPGRWRRIPRAMSRSMKARKALEEGNRSTLEYADRLEKMDDSGCDTEEAKIGFRAFQAKFVPILRSIATTKPGDMVFVHKPPSDTLEEHLTAEEMEAHFPDSPCHQAQHFATLALAHYNAGKTTYKFDLSKPLLSKCFSEICGTTYAHVNFTAIPQKNQNDEHLPKTKRLFFAELMLIPDLQAYKDTEPMRVLYVSTIDDDSCFGGCHEIFRKINHALRRNMDYERCHACRSLLKHPRGHLFVGGHNSSRMPYYSAT